jgi:prephenate dehydrogenase
MRPHFEVSVVVEDKPGMIAHIANTLAEVNINIKDIEVLKVREGDAGQLRLAFESAADRETAIRLLCQSGLEAREMD